MMRTDAAGEDRVAVEQQMVRGDRGRDVRTGRAHELRGFGGGDVLEHHLEPGEAPHQRRQRALDEDALAIEHIDLRPGGLAMHAQHHAELFHALEHRIDLVDRGDAGVGVGRGTRRVELACNDVTTVPGAIDLVRGQVVGQVQAHQRLETGALRSGKDALAIGQRLRGRGDRRLEVGHDQRATETRGGVRHDRLERGIVAHVKVPVVRTDKGNR